MTQSDRIPIVYARRMAGRETDLLVVRCCHCDKDHTHGVGGIGLPVGAGDGHRVADCGRGSYEVREYRRPRGFHRGTQHRNAHVGRTFGKAGFWPTLVEATKGADIGVIASVGRADMDLGLIPTNFVVNRHAPQAFIIPHCRAVVSGGFTTPTLGAISLGRPTLMFPTGGETRDNAERVEGARCGLAIARDDVRADLVNNALFSMCENRELKEASVGMQSALGRIPSFHVAADLVESLQGGARQVSIAKQTSESEPYCVTVG